MENKKLLILSELGNSLSYSYVIKDLKNILEERFDCHYFCIRNLGNDRCRRRLKEYGYNMDKVYFIDENLFFDHNGNLIDNEKYKDVYWSKFESLYYPGDYAIKDSDGYLWLLGRSDDVLKVAGHRIGTAELESSIVSHNDVAESAVCGIPDDVKGESIIAFVMLKENISTSWLWHSSQVNRTSKNVVMGAQSNQWIDRTVVFFLWIFPRLIR